MSAISSNKRIAKNALLLYIRMATVMLLSFYISRVVLRSLGVEDFGIYNIVGGVVAMFAYLNSSLTAATQRFLNFEMGRNHTEALNNVFCMSMNIHIILAIIVLFFSETLGLWFLNTHIVIPVERITAANLVYQFSILSTIIQIVTIPYSALVTAHERMSFIAYVSIFEVLMKLCFVLLLNFTDKDNLIEYAFYIMLATVISRLSYILFSLLNYRESKYRVSWDRCLFKEMFKFTGWNFMGATAGIAMNQGVNILLNLFEGPIVNAARAIAMQVQNAFAQLATNFTMAVNPQIVKSYSSGDIARMTNLVITSSKYAFLIMTASAMPFLVKMDFVLNLWLTDVPNYSSSFTIWMLIYQVTLCLTYSINMTSQASGNIRLFQIVESSTLILIVPISWLLLKFGHEPVSIFMSMVALSIIALLLRLLVLKKTVRFEIKKYIKETLFPVSKVSILYVILFVVSNLLFRSEKSILLNISHMIIILLLAILVCFLVGLDNRERRMIYNFIRTKLNIGNK